MLRSHLATNATYVERFHREARAAAQLVHPNIVQIYEVGCAEGVHFIAQEYVQGSNLAELLARRGPPKLDRSLAIMRQVAAALHKAAEHGIVHRDIKPENIMLAANGDVKVADFGLARLYGQQAATNLTQDGITMGTPLYMSPEQVEGRPLDPRSDIYSLGVTCYQMFAGEPPFRGESALGVAVQHLKSPPSRLENIRPDLPPAVSRIVHKMLAKNPADRFSTPRELARELRAVSVELFPDLGEDDDFSGWEGEDVTSTVEARRVATQRLASAMRTTALPVVGRRALSRWVLAGVACFAIGTALAYMYRDRPLIAPAADSEQVVPRYDTAAAQYIYASMIDTEPAWRSIEAYFPGDATYARRAKQGLALVYLRERKYTRALKIFDEFARMNDAEVQFKAFGLAGQAVVLNRLGQYEQSAQRLSALWPISDKLDRDMRALVGPTLNSNRSKLGETQELKPWHEWFETSSPSAEPDTAAPPAPSSGSR